MRNREAVIHRELCKYIRLKYPKVLFTSDLGGVRLTKKQAITAKLLRKKRGHPDLTLYEPRGGAVGLQIELKAESARIWKRDGTLRKNEHLQEQLEYMNDLQKRGWSCTFAIGLDEAIRIIDSYMKGKANATIYYTDQKPL